MNIKSKELTRRSFVRKAAVAGAAVAFSSALKPSLRAFAETGAAPPGVQNRCMSWMVELSKSEATRIPR
jgi:hypothetical protein